MDRGLESPRRAPAGTAGVSRRRQAVSAGLTLATLCVPHAWSQPPSAPASPERLPRTLQVRVGPAQTLEQLAERLYGTERLAPLLARAGWPGDPKANATIDVPLARILSLPAGTSLSQVAARWCGTGNRWPVLAALSGIDRPEALSPKTPIVLPAILEVRVRRGDSLGRLAYLAWGESRGAALLARWNGLNVDEPLQVGQRLEIPLGGPRRGADAAAAEFSSARGFP